jgi:hypothetical protein
MGALDGLLDQVKNAITQHATDNKLDAGGLLKQVTDMFGSHPHNAPSHPNTKPASQDPYGDPGDTAGGAKNVKPASQDPYGDPADDKRR